MIMYDSYFKFYNQLVFVRGYYTLQVWTTFVIIKLHKPDLVYNKAISQSLIAATIYFSPLSCPQFASPNSKEWERVLRGLYT